MKTIFLSTSPQWCPIAWTIMTKWRLKQNNFHQRPMNLQQFPRQETSIFLLQHEAGCQQFCSQLEYSWAGSQLHLCLQNVRQRLLSHITSWTTMLFLFNELCTILAIILSPPSSPRLLGCNSISISVSPMGGVMLSLVWFYPSGSPPSLMNWVC